MVARVQTSRVSGDGRLVALTPVAHAAVPIPKSRTTTAIRAITPRRLSSLFTDRLFTSTVF